MTRGADIDVRWAVFDLGGVFVPERSADIHAAVAARAGIESSKWLQTISPGLDQATCGALTIRQVYENAIRSLAIQTPSAGDLLDVHVSTYRALCLRQDPDMIALLQELRALVSVACLSNVEPEIMELTAATGIHARFERAYLSPRMGFKKPDPEIYRRAISDLGCPAGVIVFVDDKPENIKAAESVGMIGIRFQNARQLRATLCARLPALGQPGTD